MIIMININYLKFISILILASLTWLTGSTIEVFIPDQEAQVGDTLLIPVQVDTITSSDSVSSYNGCLIYDPNILEIIKTETEATLSQNAMITTNIKNDEILIAMACSTYITGEKPLLYLQAICVGTGSSDLKWSSFLFNTGQPQAETIDSHFFSTSSALIKEDSKQLESHSLKNNYPNPFNSSTTIKYKVGSPGSVNISIYNIQGEKIVTLKNGYHTSGNYKIRWNAGDATNQKVSSGIYIIEMKSGDFIDSKKLLYTK